MLNNIRLATMLEESKKAGKPKAKYLLEVMSEQEEKIMSALGLENLQNEQPKIKDVGVYKYLAPIFMMLCLLQRFASRVVINSR